jgi:hypothetical protein
MRPYLLAIALVFSTLPAHANTASELAAKKASFPVSPLAHSADPYARDCATKYLRAVSAIPVTNIPAGVRMVLAQIDADLRIYDAQAKGNHESRSVGQMVLIARANAKWLRERVRPFVLSLGEIK